MGEIEKEQAASGAAIRIIQLLPEFLFVPSR